MPDISKPIELSFVFGTIAGIFIVIGIGIYFVKKYAYTHPTNISPL